MQNDQIWDFLKFQNYFSKKGIGNKRRGLHV
jgi:hypothetical protein